MGMIIATPDGVWLAVRFGSTTEPWVTDKAQVAALQRQHGGKAPPGCIIGIARSNLRDPSADSPMWLPTQ